MSATAVHVNTYTHSATYVADKMLISLRRIIVWSGLDPSKFTNDWVTVEKGIATWLRDKDLRRVILEIFAPGTGKLVGRWDFDIFYSSETDDDGAFWADTDAIEHAIKKQGLIPADCDYSVLADLKLFGRDVPGWHSAQLRSTSGLVRHCVGTTIGANQISSGTAFWRSNT